MATAAISPEASTIPVESSNLAAANSLSEIAQKVKERGAWIFGESESKRRLITIEKKEGSYGFTLQSYGVRYKHGNRETDFITYVNAVEKEGAAFYAGLREGDVLLSINGQNMARVEHRSLVSFIRKCPTHLKMVVVSDERARKVELHMRYVHLQKRLHDKMQELEKLNKAEKEILLGTFEQGGSGAASCLADVTSACCFCPTAGKLFLDDKEKSKSMRSSKSKDKDLYFDSYRKSQSTKELNTESVVSGSIVGIQSSKKTQSGGELSSLSSASAGATGGGVASGTSSSGGQCFYAPKHSHTISHQKPSTSSAGVEPKSWDNLMTTKSFGGFGFGYGYGYYPSKAPTGGGHDHFSHPHHHNHHTHCGSHQHSSYYYNSGSGGSNKSGASKGSASACVQQPSTSSKRSSIDSAFHGNGESSRPFTNYTTYKMVGTQKVVARVTMGNLESATRTLPSMRSSSSSRQTPDTASFSSGKLERTLSDSSLNSEQHKDFPKSISYFNRVSENNDGHYSSDDDYDEYATEPNFGPKNDIYV